MSNYKYISDWKVLSIMIGSIILVWGAVWIGLHTYIITFLVERSEQGLPMPEQFKDHKLGAWSFIWTYHSGILIGVLGIIAGLGLILKKKLSWSIALALSIYEIYHSIRLFIQATSDSNSESLNKNLALGLGTLFLIISILLLLPKIRTRYSVDRRNVIYLVIITAVLALDSVLW
jgi:hypothetical protein